MEGSKDTNNEMSTFRGFIDEAVIGSSVEIFTSGSFGEVNLPHFNYRHDEIYFLKRKM